MSFMSSADRVGNHVVFVMIHCMDCMVDTYSFAIVKSFFSLYSLNGIHQYLCHIPAYFWLNLMIAYYSHKSTNTQSQNLK